MLVVVWSSLFGVGRLICVACCLLCVVFLLVVSCLLIVVCCLWFVVYGCLLACVIDRRLVFVACRCVLFVDGCMLSVC